MVRDAEDDYLLRAARSAPYLGRDEERAHLEAWCGRRDRRALDALVSSHLRLVAPPATRHARYGVPFADLFQEGAIGLVEAAERFDLSQPFRFSTYASWWVRSSIQDCVLRNWSLVRMSSSANQKKLFFSLRYLRASIEASGGAATTQDDVRREVARLTGMTEAEVARAWARQAADYSLNSPLGDEEGTGEAIDMLVDSGPLPDALAEDSVDGQRVRAVVAAAMAGLSERERGIIEARRLCDADDVVTLEDLSRRFGVTRERVRQIETRALEKLRKALPVERVLARA